MANAAHRLVEVEGQQRSTTETLEALRRNWETTNDEFKQACSRLDAAIGANMQSRVEANQKAHREALSRLSKEELPKQIASMTAGTMTKEELDSWHATRLEQITKEYTLSTNPADYSDRNAAAEADKLNTKLREIERNIVDESKKYADQSKEILTLNSVLWATLNLIDMIYFSLGIATTINFGDIIPNSTKVRFIVMLQVGICLLLVGLVVNLISEKL
jgi:Ion channel